MNRSVLVGLLVVAVLTSTGAIGPASGMQYDSTATAAGATGDDAQAGTYAFAQTSSNQEFDRTYFEITVYENGSARWTSRHERPLETEDGGNDVESFESFAEEFESQETDLYKRFTMQAQTLVNSGAERTGREMTATSFNRSARVDHKIRGTVGVVEMSFLWEGFADVNEDGDRIVVGDVFDNLYLGSDQELIIERSDGLVFVTARPDGRYPTVSLEDANSITWRGEQAFIEGQPRVILEREGSDESSSILPVGSPGLVAATLLIVSLAAAGAVAWRRKAHSSSDVIGTVVSSDTADDGPAESDDGSLARDELLTDEDRVVKLIRENGGRMKQVDIVEETGWSKSKVSMLLSEMESDGTISKLRVGRENIISLDGFEPEATKSPFEE